MLYRFLGSGWILLPVVLLVWRWWPEKVKYLLIAVVLESLLVIILKSLYLQPRPAAVLSHVHLLLPLRTHSFPSGDAAMAFTIAGSLVIGQPWQRSVLLWGYAVLIAYERMYLGVHFPLDVLSGALLGILAAISAYHVLDSNAGQRIQNSYTNWQHSMRHPFHREQSG
ncbi:MAG TPA: phosphatase PAP2 family protein [Armatimonadota bacterium]|nr:phosphatase PAP2 family protein [Armatimonadota bacterium]